MRLAVLVVLGLSISGCAAQLEKSALVQARGQCTAKGLRFVPTDAKRSERIVVSSAMVTGECVGADDPRFATAQQD